AAATQPETELRNLADGPPRTRLLPLRRSAQLRLDVPADDPVPGPRQGTADPAGSTPGIQHPRTTRHHGIHQPGLPHNILTGTDHGPEPLDVPGGVSRVLGDLLHPDALLNHALIIRLLDRPTCDGSIRTATTPPGWSPTASATPVRTRSPPSSGPRSECPWRPRTEPTPRRK